jgi:hypothetical protein
METFIYEYTKMYIEIYYSKLIVVYYDLVKNRIMKIIQAQRLSL